MLIRNQNGCHVVNKLLALICPIDFRNQNLELAEASVNFVCYLIEVLLCSEMFVSICNNQYGVIVIKHIVHLCNFSRLQKHAAPDALAKIHDSFSLFKHRLYVSVVSQFLNLA